MSALRDKKKRVYTKHILHFRPPHTFLASFCAIGEMREIAGQVVVPSDKVIGENWVSEGIMTK